MDELSNRLRITEQEMRQKIGGWGDITNLTEATPIWETAYNQAEQKAWRPDIRQALFALQEAGIISLDQALDAEGKRVIVCDLDRFRGDFNWMEIRSHLGPITMTAEGRKKTKIQTLADIFQSLHVVTKEARGDKPRRLFYIPENDEAALDPKKIKQAEPCYLGLWQVAGKLTEYPMKVEQPSDTATPSEVAVAALIYHRSFGNGERDNDGILRVTYPDGVIRPVKAKYFGEVDLNNKQIRLAAPMRSSPRTFLETEGIRLVERDILRPTDFRTQAGGAGEQYRILGRRIPPNGQLMLSGRRISIGRKYATPEYSVTQLSPDFALLIHQKNEKSQIEEVIRLPQVDTTNRYVGTDQWSRHSLDDFAALYPTEMKLIEQFGDYIKFSEKLVKEHNLNLALMSAREQAMVWQVFCEFGSNHTFWKFLENQGSDGLLALMVAEESLPNASKVLEIGNHPQASFLFENLAAILRTIGSTEALIQRLPPTDGPDPERVTLVSDMIIKHAGKLFLSAYEVGTRNLGVSMQDVTHALYRYRRQVESWHQTTFLRGSREHNAYLGLLGAFDRVPEGSNAQTLLLSMIEQAWEQDVVREAKKPENQALGRALERIRGFYADNKELFEAASTTTGDTETELAELQEFFTTFNSIDGLVVDLACGDRKRLTEPMATMLAGKAKVYGLDIWSPGKNTHPNLEVVEGSIGAMPFADHSVAVATLNWSPPNDWVSRVDQLMNFGELGRVMKPGGIVRADVAFLEGGENSWMEAVEDQYSQGGRKFGDVKIMFPGERQGEFHIYPLSELKAHLLSAGFGEMQIDVWRTKAGKPRVTIAAKYQGKSNPLP